MEYEGTHYHGWQFQPGLPTIQGELQEAVSCSLREVREVEGASRTDRGVHAFGQAAAFLTASPVPTPRLPVVLNSRLPKDIRVRQAREVPSDFKPRFEAYGKIYRYTFLCRAMESPFLRRFATRVDRRLNVASMQRAADCLVGRHDFSSFKNATKDHVETTIRDLFEIRVVEEESLVHVIVAGSAFLYNMVRNIAGTLLEVGLERRSADTMKEVLRARNRRAAGVNAEARGLCLIGVFFEKEALERGLLCKKLLLPLCTL